MLLLEKTMLTFASNSQVTASVSLRLLSPWKKAFEASYVDQHIAAAGAWNSIRGIHPLTSPLYPSFFTIDSITSPIELVLNRSQPQTPYTRGKPLPIIRTWPQTATQTHLNNLHWLVEKRTAIANTKYVSSTGHRSRKRSAHIRAHCCSRLQSRPSATISK